MDIWQIFSILLTAIFSMAVFGTYRKTGIVKACVISMGFFVLGFYLDGFFALIMQGFFRSGLQVFTQILGMVISKSIAVTVLLGMQVLAKEEISHGSAEITWKYHDGLTLAVSIFFLLLGFYVWWQKDVGTVGLRVLVLLVLLILLVTYYSSLYLHLQKQREKVSRSHEERRKHEAQVYLANVENNYQRTRELWHDLKNHINLMNLLLQDGKYEELGDYLRIFNEDVDSLTLPAKSGNLIVDALLADKAARAKRERVEVVLDLCDLTGLKLQPDEICGLLGNLLDNALEANKRLREDRSLEVTCKELEECYYIRVRNPVSEMSERVCVERMDTETHDHREVQGASVERSEDKLRTTKTDKRNRVGHGLGLRSAERIVHGCGGEIVVDYGEKYFTVVVRLPR